MPAQLEISSDSEQQQTEKKSQSDVTKEITAELIKHESENHHDRFQMEETETAFEPNNHNNKVIETIPDIIESPPELIQDAPSKPELVSELSSQPDIVPETDSKPVPTSEEPEVCSLIRHSEPEVTLELTSEPITAELGSMPIDTSEPKIQLTSEQPETPVEVDSAPEPVCVLRSPETIRYEEEEVKSVPEPATVIRAEPKIVAEVPPDTVKSLIRQSEHEEVPKAQSVQNGIPKKVQMITSLDEGAVRAAYEDVRADNTDTQWAVFKFQGSCIVKSAVGSEFEKFRAQFTENERAFGFIRVQVGDELSKRQKFVFITWVGPSVSVIQRAKMSTDKALMKNIISNFAVELQPETLSEIDLDHFVKELNKAGGANYGTGVREL